MWCSGSCYGMSGSCCNYYVNICAVPSTWLHMVATVSLYYTTLHLGPEAPRHGPRRWVDSHTIQSTVIRQHTSMHTLHQLLNIRFGLYGTFTSVFNLGYTLILISNHIQFILTLKWQMTTCNIVDLWSDVQYIAIFWFVANIKLFQIFVF